MLVTGICKFYVGDNNYNISSRLLADHCNSVI